MGKHAGSTSAVTAFSGQARRLAFTGGEPGRDYGSSADNASKTGAEERFQSRKSSVLVALEMPGRGASQTPTMRSGSVKSSRPEENGVDHGAKHRDIGANTKS